MEATALRAANSSSALQQYVGIKMLSKIKDMQTSANATMLADFAAVQQTTRQAASSLQIGANLDVRV